MNRHALATISRSATMIAFLIALGAPASAQRGRLPPDLEAYFAAERQRIQLDISKCQADLDALQRARVSMLPEEFDRRHSFVEARCTHASRESRFFDDQYNEAVRSSSPQEAEGELTPEELMVFHDRLRTLEPKQRAYESRLRHYASQTGTMTEDQMAAAKAELDRMRGEFLEARDAVLDDMKRAQKAAANNAPTNFADGVDGLNVTSLTTADTQYVLRAFRKWVLIDRKNPGAPQTVLSEKQRNKFVMNMMGPDGRVIRAVDFRKRTVSVIGRGGYIASEDAIVGWSAKVTSANLVRVIYNGGEIRMTGPGTWSETNRDGTFSFRESGRFPNLVVLTSDNRDVVLDIDLTKNLVSHGSKSNVQRTPLYPITSKQAHYLQIGGQ